MNKMKRIFSFLLVLSMILGSFAASFTVAHAAEVETADKELTKVPKDVIGTDYEKAVSRLVAFGIVGGYPDGTFKPANEVTRAEFAKILVEALGIGNATKAATGNTKFSDVPASHWASGYINVASGQGLIKGYNNGTFQPEKKVSYAEALTMLVRALGYQDNFLKGTWPGNYVAKAAEAGVTNGVKFDSATSSANRGDVAVLVNNTLDGDIVKVDIYKDGTVEYKETEKTLLKDKLDISKYEDTRIVADKIVNDGLDADEITVRFLKDIDKKETQSVRKDYKEGDEKDFRIAKTVNPRKFMGEEVSVYMDNKDKVVYIEVENDDKAYFDYVSEIPTGKDGEIEEISLVRFDKDYKFDKDATVYVFDSKDDKYVELSVDKNGIDAKIDSVVGHVGKFVVKNNRIIYAEIMDSSEALPWMLVRENKKGLLEGINQTTEDFDLDLSKDGNYDGVLVFDTLGNKLDVEDIKEGNIVYAQKQEYDGDDYAVVVVVTDNAVEGKLSKVKNDRVTLGDKQTKVVQYVAESKQYQAYYSVEGFEEVKEWTGKDNDEWATDMEDADEETMTAYLDAAGRIAFLTTKTKATSGYKYGVVVKAYSDNDRVKIYTYVDGKDGEEITYRVEKERSLRAPMLLNEYGAETKEKGSSIKDGDVVKFKLNKAGEIAEDELYVMDAKNTWKMRDEKDFGKDSIPSKSYDGKLERSFAIDDKAVIIDAEGLKHNSDRTGFLEFDVDDFSIAKWKDMSENKYDKDLEYYVFTKRNNNVDVDAVIFIGKGASTSSDEEAVYIIDKWTKGGDVYVKYVSYETGKVEEKQVDKLDKSGSVKFGDFKKQRPFIAKIKSSGKIDLFNEATDELTYVAGVITEKDGNIIKIGTDKTEYKLSTSAVVYEEDVKKTTSNIRKGDSVYFVVENKVNIRAIERLIDDEATDIKDGVNIYKETGITVGKGSGTGTTPGKPEEKNLVTYANKDQMIVGGVIYRANKDTIVKDANGKVIALGSFEGITTGDEVSIDKDVVTIKVSALEKDVANLKAAKEAVTALETAAKKDLKVEENLKAAEAALEKAEKAVALVADKTEKATLESTIKTEKAKIEKARKEFDAAPAEEAVTALENAAKEDLEVEENLKKAEAALEKAEKAMANVTDASLKLKFVNAKKKVTDAREAFDLKAATDAVVAAEGATVTTSEEIIAAEKLVKEAKAAVALVKDSAENKKLADRIKAVETKIETAKAAVAETAVTALENAVKDLSDKDKVDAAEALVKPAKDAVAKVTGDKTALELRLQIAIEKIEAAK
ncbi:S-layer homology domain-containing protein [Tissierella praeacuta]|uniref:S-layer homology domain-containing protein n=1 Tax=Tissierella praeacuta TaxID=43131 RepID=UPI001C0F637F|nr:S-layer homology domain-containing protein [Tissierella praeacuta]MBU5255533.1 S-layer homology domain-containing protein [Tissierella praeacuta]